jgi:hypothetical protein
MFHVPLSIVLILTLDTQVLQMMAMPRLTFVVWFRGGHYLISRMMANRSFSVLNM